MKQDTVANEVTPLVGKIDKKAIDHEPTIEKYWQDEPGQEGERYDRSILKDVVTSARDVAEDVAEAFREVLHEADEVERAAFVEMGLTRNLSILPSDVTDAGLSKRHLISLSTPGGQDIEALPEVQQEAATQRPWYSYLVLAIAVTSLSSLGPLMELQKNTSPNMKLIWRMAGTAFMLFPFAVAEIRKLGWPQLTSAQWISFLLSTFCYDTASVTFVIALDFTSVGNVVILANSLALIILIGKLFMGDHVSFAEGAGAIVAFVGCALCSKDSADSQAGLTGLWWWGLWGDFLATLAAVGGVGYLVFAKSCRQQMEICTFMFLTMFVGCIMIIIFQVTVMGEEFTMDMDLYHGMWGFLHLQPDRLPLEIAMVVVCNLLGAMGYVIAMQYFDNFVISSAALCEPVVAEFMAFFWGVSSLPGLQGWIGNLMVAAGTFAVVNADSEKKKGTSKPDPSKTDAN